ncbi:DegQ family serine endoprotease [Marinihelvus fidelis]|uniref:Probable periplasmic serine endoprotease DegP-like n=2 Tax=Marinihelvus fidelis TaxID=2613842 RepID=A0A5N0TEV0_9GAMM|nr:DegQ family serine endoprotease [Marinihelvus fidelis]
MLALGAALLMAAAAQARVTGLPDFTELVEDVGPAVVNIRVTQFGDQAENQLRQQNTDPDAQPSPYGQEDVPEFFRRFFGTPDGRGFSQPDRSGAGSGFIVDESGYVVTNHHVVDGADEIIVRLADRREFEAELVGSDPLSDIALLKIEAANLPALEWGDSGALRQGEWVIAIGSPFNFDQSVTAGIVSATGRSNANQAYVPFIQTDVAINRGNSGGPLLNMDGQVVGVNSWILSSSGGYIGLSFSIPADVAVSTTSQLREHGTVRRGLLGVQVGEVTRELAEALDLDRPVGALVNDVTDDSAAEEAGIEPGDIILAFNGQSIETWNDLPPLVGANPPGTEATVLVSRNGREREFDVVLHALEEDEQTLLGDEEEEPASSNVLGLAVENLGEDRRRRAEAPEGGVLVAEVESAAAWRAGIRPGDLILMINTRPIDGVDDFQDIVEDLPEGRAVALRVWRNGNTSFLAYTPDEGDMD